MSPRAGIRYSMRTRPVPWFVILTIWPRRVPTFWVTTPMYSSGQSTTRCSIGSSRCPSSMRVMTSGWPTSTSYPSRRIISIRMASWSSPRPETRNVSGASVSSIRIATLVRASLKRRSRRCRDVTYLPSRPAKGETFAENSMATVGSSIRIGGSATGRSGSASVSPISIASMPATATTSPGPRLGHLDPPEALVHVDDRDLGGLHRAGAPDDGDAVGGADARRSSRGR